MTDLSPSKCYPGAIYSAPIYRNSPRADAEACATFLTRERGEAFSAELQWAGGLLTETEYIIRRPVSEPQSGCNMVPLGVKPSTSLIQEFLKWIGLVD